MLSRVAETIYWMQRYRERVENTARLVMVNLALSADAPKNIGDQWMPLIETTGGEDLFKSMGKEANAKNAIDFLTFDLNNPNSILSCLIKTRENARSIREVITSEMWVELNTLYLFIKKTSLDMKSFESVYGFFNRIVRQCQLVTGIADTCMNHSESWYFARIGNLIERADMTTRILDVKYFILLPSPKYVGTPFDNIQWSALLKSASALEMYRKTWNKIQPDRVVHFLILNEEFPRAVASCLFRMEKSLEYLRDKNAPTEPSKPLESVKALRESLKGLSGDGIIEKGFHEVIDSLQIDLAKVHDSLYEQYFSIHLPVIQESYENI